MLTAAPSGEARGAQWAEIDSTDHVWTLSALRMKEKGSTVFGHAAGGWSSSTRRGRPQSPRVPDAEREADIRINAAQDVPGPSDHAAPHAFRSSFRDRAAQKTDHPRNVIEGALLHVVQNKVDAAYARSDLLNRPRLRMDD